MAEITIGKFKRLLGLCGGCVECCGILLECCHNCGGEPSPNITTTEELDGFAFRVVGLEKEDILLSSLESKGVQLEGRRDVSMVELKALAADFLDRRSMLRLLVLAEPDFLPREHALAKVLVFARVFYQELSTK